VRIFLQEFLDHAIFQGLHQREQNGRVILRVPSFRPQINPLILTPESGIVNTKHEANVISLTDSSFFWAVYNLKGNP
jgi:hypothetical protein